MIPSTYQLYRTQSTCSRSVTDFPQGPDWAREIPSQARLNPGIPSHGQARARILVQGPRYMHPPTRYPPYPPPGTHPAVRTPGGDHEHATGYPCAHVHVSICRFPGRASLAGSCLELARDAQAGYSSLEYKIYLLLWRPSIWTSVGKHG